MVAIMKTKQQAEDPVRFEWRRKKVAMKSKPELSFGSGKKWIRGVKIGEGGFGSVFVAFSKRRYIERDHLPEAMAIKSAILKHAASIRYEFSVFKDLNNGEYCPFIIDHYWEEVTMSNKGDVVLNLTMEVAWGSISRLISIVGGGLREYYVRRYIGDILQGVGHMHKKGYVHCDLKPDNILLVEDVDGYGMMAKVGDLGLAKKETDQGRWRGTPTYLAPETIQNVQEKPSDIWSVGCIVLEMLTGKRPRNHFYDSDSDSLCIVDGIRPNIPDTISSLAREFVGLCLEEVPEHRWTAEELLSHPFVADTVR